MARNIPVGIDLGTTNSVVACLTPEGETKVLANSEGELLTPSVVIFNDDHVVVGRAARDAGAVDLSRTAECAKRDMGSAYYHRLIGDKQIPPEAIQAFVLRKLHRDIVSRLTDDSDVVISVPAYFDEARRHATMDAGRMSGLNVVDIVNEPTAAALAYGQSLGYLSPSGKARGRIRILVYDLGGGTFDVTVIEFKGSDILTLATDGDVRLGGYDWDMRLVDYVKELILAQHPTAPPFDDRTSFELRRQLERAKHELSRGPAVDIKISHGGQSFDFHLTRELFAELTADLLERTAFTTRQTVRAAGLTFSDIDRILLVGGSTRMPIVREMLTDLCGKAPEVAIDPDEAVARGAAICAFLRRREAEDGSDGFGLRITDVAAHSLGIEGIDERTLRKENIILIPKNSALPATVRREFVTKEDNQQNVLVRLLEGESKQPEHCTELGRARINNLPVGLPKGTKVQVAYNFDRSGRLSVEAQIPGVGREAKMELQRVRAMPSARMQQWRKIVCEDGGYSAFEGIAKIIEHALVDQPGEPAETPPPAPTPAKNLKFEPAVPEGAPLAASEVLKHNIPTRPGQSVLARHSLPPQSGNPSAHFWRNLIGYVVFSLLGLIAGVLAVCWADPRFLKYLPTWLANVVKLVVG